MDALLEKLELTSRVSLPDGTKIDPYLADPGLLEAVNLAAHLRRPLLVKGEPGCGKTKLAPALAYALNQEALEKKKASWREVYFEWHVKSISKARDGLYRYDYIGRLQDAQLQKTGDPTSQVKPEPDYVKEGPLGAAFEATKSKHRVVVLIDEIDKADPDFPNDLLRELDEMRYTVDEIDGQIYPQEKERAARPENRPIVIITSNDEKELPVAFLRRCLFYHIDFPKEDHLRRIVAAHFSRVEDEAVVQKVVAVFSKLRERMEREKEERDKKVTTSELIDWCRVLLLDKEEKIMKLLSGELPYGPILFKEKLDHARFAKAHLTAE